MKGIFVYLLWALIRVNLDVRMSLVWPEAYNNEKYGVDDEEQIAERVRLRPRLFGWRVGNEMKNSTNNGRRGLKN